MTHVDASTIRRARRARVRSIRQRVVAGAVALFIATWLLIAGLLITGNDPALAHRAAKPVTAATTSTATATTSTTPSSTNTASATTTASGNSTSGTSSSGSSTSTATGSGASSVTSSQS